MSFYRELDMPRYTYGEPKWKIYDDNHIEEFYYWKDVIKRCAETTMRPTLLFYQKVDTVPSLSYSSKINNYDIRELERIIESS